MAAPNGGLRVPSAASSSRASVAASQSTRSQRGQNQSTIRTIVTSPPWAQDEPPSPTDDDKDDHTTLHRPSDGRPSDAGSYHSSGPPGSAHASRWWAFTKPNGADRSQVLIPPEGPSQNAVKQEKRGIMFRDKSLSWFPANHRRPVEAPGFSPRPTGFEGHRSSLSAHQSNWGLTIDLPPPPSAPFTMAQSRTPGWDSPWTPRAHRNGMSRDEEMFGHDDSETEKLGTWSSRKKKLRKFVLTNSYVPLLFRFINIIFTTAALAIAARIRFYERQYHVAGAVGSSPTLVIIFAPLTLVHVIAAIYLEYFGRPLGLWKTSSKLTHTLFEVLFICAWSAALSLCFDNFFTSLIPCAASTSTSWYNELPRPQSPLPYLGGLGDRICDDQLVLIVLVGLGLLMYCTNLVISLFRIFEKVKYHPAARMST